MLRHNIGGGTGYYPNFLRGMAAIASSSFLGSLAGHLLELYAPHNTFVCN